MAGKPSSREAILAAAESVALRRGAAHLTLEAVAKEAGVSKGGLLYHFRTKETLLEGMIAYRIDQCVADRRKAEARFPRDNAALLKAIVEAGLDDNDPSRKFHAAALAATANNPRLLGPAKDHNKELFRELSRFQSFERASVVVLAVHGLWLMETLQTSPLTKRQRSEIIRELFLLAESAAHPSGSRR
jgi:AcrR family transcriptional regulator